MFSRKLSSKFKLSQMLSFRFFNLKVCIAIIGVTLIFLGMNSCSAKKEFIILSGSENEALEPIIQQFAKDNNYNVTFKLKGSVDIMLELQNNPSQYDAVWPASGIWITLGDNSKKVKYAQSVLTSPVVFGIKKSLAQQLGFVGKDVKVADILAAIQSKKLKFIMTSASQSNSGASAYFGFLYALLGNPEFISKTDLHKPELKTQIRQLLSGINRSSGSSGWLKDLYLKGNYDAMVNYESTIIETNQELVKQGREPLYVVYPVDGLVIADSQLGYVNNGDADKEDFFKKLQAYILSADVQKQFLDLGRRTGFAGVVQNAPANVFNPDWGINTSKILSPIKMPSSDVILEALNMYQTEFRKPSLTVFCLDYSGSMDGERIKQLKESINILLDPDKAKQYLLQPSPEDVIVVIPFSDSPGEVWTLRGNNPDSLNDLIAKINNYSVGGGTDIYSPCMNGIDIISKMDTGQFNSAVILMTDGESNAGATFSDFSSDWTSMGKDIPVFAITFGEASEDQLNQIVNLTRANTFDGKTDLVTAFRKAKGYN
jgi:Ca-activated chloride channel family protein